MSLSPHLQQFRAFAKYNARFNRRLFDLAAELGEDVRARDLGAFFGSIDGTLRHILLADRIWLRRFAGSGHFPSLEKADLAYDFQGSLAIYPGDFASLSRDRTATDEAICAWADELTDELLASTFRYANLAGKAREHAMWIAVAHLFNHQTHHRGQVTTLFKQVGVDPGVTDFLVYAIE